MSTLSGTIDAGRHSPYGGLLAGGLAIVLGLATAIDPRMGALLAAMLVAPVLVWAPPVVPLSLLAVSLGLNIDVIVAPIHVSLPQLAGLALIGGVAIRQGTDRRAAGRWALAGGIFAIATLPSMLSPVVRSAAVSGVAQLIVAALILWAATHALARRETAYDLAVRLFVAGGLVSLVPAFAQVLFGIGPAEYAIGCVMRAYSTYAQPNSYGAYLSGVLPVAIALGMSRGRRAYVLAAIAIAAGIILTGSRGAWAGALGGLGIFMLITFRPRATTLLALAGGLLLVGAAVLLIPESFIVGRLDLTDWSSRQRLLVLLTAIDGIIRNPLTGYGPGAFESMLPAIARTGLVDDVRMPHNLFLHVWFELGLAALLVLLVLLAGYYRSALRAYRRSHDVVLAGLIGGVSSMLCASMFGTLFIRGIQEAFLFLVAMTAFAVVATNEAYPRVREST
jgi:O-antigen ligase